MLIFLNFALSLRANTPEFWFETSGTYCIPEFWFEPSGTYSWTLVWAIRHIFLNFGLSHLAHIPEFWFEPSGTYSWILIWAIWHIFLNFGLRLKTHIPELWFDPSGTGAFRYIYLISQEIFFPCILQYNIMEKCKQIIVFYLTKLTLFNALIIIKLWSSCFRTTHYLSWMNLSTTHTHHTYMNLSATHTHHTYMNLSTTHDLQYTLYLHCPEYHTYPLPIPTSPTWPYVQHTYPITHTLTKHACLHARK